MAHSVGVISDTHVYAGSRRSDSSEADAKTAIDQLNSVGVDWTAHCGDLRPLGSVTSPSIVDWGGWDGESNNEFYHQDFSVIKDLLDNRLNGSVNIAPGNHDRPKPVLRDYFSPEDYSPSDDLGRTGGFWGVEKYDGARYAYLDSNPTEGWHVEEQPGNFVSASQLSMLDRLAEKDSQIPTFVFCHSPLARMDDGRDWYADRNTTYFLASNFRSIQHRLEKMNTVAVLTGDTYDSGIRSQTAVNGVAYNQVDHLGGGNSGDVRWMNVDTMNNTATVHWYNVSTGNQGSFGQLTW